MGKCSGYHVPGIKISISSKVDISTFVLSTIDMRMRTQQSGKQSIDSMLKVKAKGDASPDQWQLIGANGTTAAHYARFPLFRNATHRIASVSIRQKRREKKSVTQQLACQHSNADGRY